MVEMLFGVLLLVVLCGDLTAGQTCQANALRRDCGKNFIMNKFTRDFPGQVNFLYRIKAAMVTDVCCTKCIELLS